MGRTDLTTMQSTLKHIQDEIYIVVPDYKDFTVLQLGSGKPHLIFYNTCGDCTKEKAQKIERVIREQAKRLNLPVTTDEIE